MAVLHCPGQDLRYWKLDDIYEVVCMHCGALIEFFKDDPRRKCKACGKHMLNPRNDMSCAQWCKHAKECLESLERTRLSIPPDLISQESSPGHYGRYSQSGVSSCDFASP